MKKMAFIHSARIRVLVLILTGIVPLSACGGGGSETSSPAPQETAKAPSPPPTQGTSTASPTGQQAGSIAVRVTLTGEPPVLQALEVNKDAEVCAKTEKFSETLIVGPDKGVQHVVAYLASVAGAKPLPVPEQNPAIDQTGCRYEPHVLLVPAGATVDIKNSDNILHNIHTYSTKNPAFNMAQPKFQKVIQKTFDQPETIKVTCDVHAWMSAWVVVQEHGYYAVTDATGLARLKDVPPGKYDLKIWHETFGDQVAGTKISVKAGEESNATINLNSPAQNPN